MKSVLILAFLLSGCSEDHLYCVTRAMTAYTYKDEKVERTSPALTYEQAIKVCGVK